MRNITRRLLPLLALVLAVATSAPDAVWAQDGTPPTVADRELVVILHGMGRTPRSMRPMEAALETAGFAVLNIGYSSYCCGIAELGAEVRRRLDAERGSYRTVHFVGHSLGGILIRWMFAQEHPPEGVGRVVLLAPPNQGARSADRYAGVLDWLLEPIDELRTDSSATVRRLPDSLPVPVAVIAAEHDGKVDVAETHLKGEAAHAVVDANHAFIMRNEVAIRFTVGFLRDGRFPPLAPLPH